MGLCDSGFYGSMGIHKRIFVDWLPWYVIKALFSLDIGRLGTILMVGIMDYISGIPFVLE